MQCPRCQHENEAGAKFCEECAAPLARARAKCGRTLSRTAKFCPECAHPTGLSAAPAPRFDSPESYTPKHLAERILTSKAALEGERKQVTVLFADLKGAMELLADRDPEEARKLLDPVLERMMEAVHRYEGTVNQVMGDGIMALFGAPLAHEDHAVRACYAALRMQESVKRYAEEVHRTAGVPLHIRVGLNSGEVVVRSIGSDLRMDYTAVGQTTHLAARLEQMAMPGAILISAETLNLAEGYVVVKSLGERLVKGNDTKSGSSRREGGLTSFWRGTGVRFACWLAAASGGPNRGGCGHSFWHSREEAESDPSTCVVEYLAVLREAMMTLTIEIEREEDGRWIAEVPGLSGVLCYGGTRDEAIARVQALALRVIAERLEHGEAPPELLTVSFEAA